VPVVVLAAALALLGACGGSDDATVRSAVSTVPSSGSAVSTVPSSGSAVSTVPSSGSAVSTVPSSGSAVQGVTPVGFDMMAARVVAADGATCDVCLWRADDDGERARGLMGVTDLGVGDGMAFVYSGPTTTAFTMQSTLIPLSIAFFAIDGVFLDAFDMEPCRAEPCPTYPTPADFGVAIEVEQGGLDALLIGSGSRLEPSDGDCPVAG
jgi:uncharacterized membrane protein (UPF0127 family)